MKRFFNIVVLVIIGMILGGCLNNPIPDNKIEIERIEVSTPKEKIEIDEEISIKVSIFPEEIDNIEIAFSSSDENVVSVSNEGLIKGLSVGMAEITASVEEVQESVTVEVIEPPLKILNSPSHELRIGEEFLLNTNKDVTWYSENNIIATVSNQGVVKAKAPGTVKISALAGEEEVTTIITVAQMDYLDTPISHLYSGMLPSVGRPKILVLMIEFPDIKFDNYFTKETITEIFFETNTGYQTVRDFYYQSSYGRLQLEGEVLDIYRTQRTSRQYERDYYDYASDVVIKEAIKFYDSRIDFSEYDSNDDGYIDNVVAIYSKGYDYYSDLWWAYNVNFDDPDTYYEGTDLKVDGVYVNNYIWASAEFLFENDNEGKDITTFIHELGHSFGLDDYYDYDEKKGPRGGLGGADLMDGTVGDHNSFSKYLLGWVEPIIIDLSDIFNEVILIESFVKSGDVILITNNRKGIFSEYILVEFYTPDKLNSNNSYLTIEGVRIFHVDAILGGNTGDYQTEFKYDNSDESKKLIRLIEADGRNDIEKGRDASNSDLFQVGNAYTIDINRNFKIVINNIDGNQAVISIQQN